MVTKTINAMNRCKNASIHEKVLFCKVVQAAEKQSLLKNFSSI